MPDDPNAPQRFDDPPAGSGVRNSEPAALPHYTPLEGQDATTPAGVALARHESRLLAIPGVVGVGIGEGISGPVVRVYLRDETVRSLVPRTVDGISVEAVVSGDIDAYGAGSGGS